MVFFLNLIILKLIVESVENRENFDNMYMEFLLENFGNILKISQIHKLVDNLEN